MAAVRHIVSQALRVRAEVGVKVRQPLGALQIADKKISKKLLELIKDEVNVKEITFGEKLNLDTEITPALKKEGMVREIVRNIQEMRRDLGLRSKNIIKLQFDGDLEITETISERQGAIKKDVNASVLKMGVKKVFKIEREMDLDGKPLWVGIEI